MAALKTKLVEFHAEWNETTVEKAYPLFPGEDLAPLRRLLDKYTPIDFGKLAADRELFIKKQIRSAALRFRRLEREPDFVQIEGRSIRMHGTEKGLRLARYFEQVYNDPQELENDLEESLAWIESLLVQEQWLIAENWLEKMKKRWPNHQNRFDEQRKAVADGLS